MNGPESFQGGKMDSDQEKKIAEQREWLKRKTAEALAQKKATEQKVRVLSGRSRLPVRKPPTSLALPVRIGKDKAAGPDDNPELVSDGKGGWIVKE